MPSVTAASQKRRLVEVADAVRALGGVATLAQIAERLGLASADGAYYRVTRAVSTGLLVRDPDQQGRHRGFMVVRLPSEASAPEPVVVTQVDRTHGWAETTLRIVQRKGTVSALDIAAYLNLPSTAAARQQLRPLVLRGVLTYDEAADTYRLGASAEGARAA